MNYYENPLYPIGNKSRQQPNKLPIKALLVISLIPLPSFTLPQSLVLLLSSRPRLRNFYSNAHEIRKAPSLSLCQRRNYGKEFSLLALSLSPFNCSVQYNPWCFSLKLLFGFSQILFFFFFSFPIPWLGSRNLCSFSFWYLGLFSFGLILVGAVVLLVLQGLGGARSDGGAEEWPCNQGDSALRWPIPQHQAWEHSGCGSGQVPPHGILFFFSIFLRFRTRVF